MIGGNPTAPPGYEGRLDLNYDSYIDISDISPTTGGIRPAMLNRRDPPPAFGL